MLSAAEFADIHASVLEAMEFVALPVTFYTARPGQATDPLYGEAVGGTEAWDALPPIKATVRFKPDDEFLTKIGARVNADLLVFIPKGYILAWEAEHGRPFRVTHADELTFDGARYSVKTTPRTDPLPSLGDDGTVGQDYIGMVVLATTKADTGR